MSVAEVSVRARMPHLPDGVPFPAAPSRPRWYIPAKRALDIVLSLAILVVAAPIVATAMLAIVVVSGGNPIYRQDRVGLDGRRFRMFKLRTMVRNAHAMLPELRRSLGEACC